VSILGPIGPAVWPHILENREHAILDKYNIDNDIHAARWWMSGTRS
jgi:hypothetical protein